MQLNGVVQTELIATAVLPRLEPKLGTVWGRCELRAVLACVGDRTDASSAPAMRQSD